MVSVWPYEISVFNDDPASALFRAGCASECLKLSNIRIICYFYVKYTQ